MTWTIRVPSTPKDMFPFDVDNATANGQEAPGVNEDVLLVKALMKTAATRVKRPYITGYASGNTLQPGNGAGTWDGFTISVSGDDDPH